MLLSMTGFGEARTHQNDLTIVSEIKSVNNRFLKTNLHFSDVYSFLEPRLESFVKKYIDRGTLTVYLKISSDKSENKSKLDTAVLKDYLDQVSGVCLDLNHESGKDLFSIGAVSNYLTLPGVIQDNDLERTEEEKDLIWRAITENLDQAFQAFNKSREKEGSQMELDLQKNCDLLTEEIESIATLAPQVVENWRVHLTERIEKIMSDNNMQLSQADLVREVAIFTDRADISEEIVRFRSHILQFEKAMKNEKNCGKKLDFLTQEMFREVNTIGSKANYSEITNHIVSMKSNIERIREMVQNVE